VTYFAEVSAKNFSTSAILRTGVKLVLPLRYSFFMVMCWNMNGMDSMSTLAMRVHRPGRTFPLAVSLIVPVVVALYILVVLCATGVNSHFNSYYTGYFAHIAGQGGACQPCTLAVHPFSL
jgi:amino acid transporter